MRKLGAIGDKETENEVLLLERDVPHLPFSAAVQKDLPIMPWNITDEVSTTDGQVIALLYEPNKFVKRTCTWSS